MVSNTHAPEQEEIPLNTQAATPRFGPGLLDVDLQRKKTIVTVCADPQANRQSAWKFADLAKLCFASSKDGTQSSKLRDFLPEIHAFHKQLWPGEDVPAEVTFNVDAQDIHWRTKFVTTSLMFAIITYLAKHTKRGTTGRMLSFRVFKKMVDTLCATEQGLGIELMILRTNGQVAWRRVHLFDPHSAELWDMRHFQEELEFTWTTDRNDLKKPWIQSHGRMPHLAEWCMFLLDVPARMQKTRRPLAALKVQLQAGALSVITQIAAAIDSRVTEVTGKISDFRLIAHRRDKLAIWTTVGHAVEKLWNGTAI